jgi:hypothetical protein
VPPASVDFISNVWNKFHETILPKLGGDARDAVTQNKDPEEIGSFASVKIQEDILECVYGKSVR